MPKTDIDYSSTIIYKITCKDAAITDVYVGHTTNFVQRKHSHKQSCLSIKSPSYTCKVYQVIRANGGWNNWKMEIINFFDCKDHYEARKKEQEYFISLNANLNSIEPMPKPKVIEHKKERTVFVCTTCNIRYNSIKLFEEHNKTKKHLKLLEPLNLENISTHTNTITGVEEHPIIIKLAKKFECIKCTYVCKKESEFNKHLATLKHTHNDKGLHEKQRKEYTCNCGKVYSFRQGLSIHKKICSFEKNEKDIVNLLIKENSDMKNIVLEIIKSNTELQKQLVEVCKNISATNISATNISATNIC